MIGIVMGSLKKQLAQLTIVLILGMVCSASWAQVSNVNAAIKIIAGEPYYIHTVLEGQTLDQIASAYFTETSAIKKVNQDLSDTPVVGIKLKIPYSDASLEAMSKKEVRTYRPGTEPKEIRAESPPPPKPAERKVQPQPTPMDEAVALIETKDPVAETPPEPTETLEAEPLTPQEQKAVKEFEALSENINESLESLSKIRAALGEEPTPAPEASPAMPEKIVYSSELLLGAMNNYFDSTSANQYRLSEYFIVSFNEDQRLFNVRDERTVTNENTHFFSVQDLHGLRIDSLNEAPKKASIGFISDVTRYPYKVKVKRKKVRVYNTKGYVEHFSKDNSHAQIILDKARQDGIRGKGEVVILEGYHQVAQFKKFEYNPFGVKDTVYYDLPVLSIEKFEF
ncbi:MAG: hypothetical protein Salg2KO_18820 [Salibacteraceae bacterium]